MLGKATNVRQKSAFYNMVIRVVLADNGQQKPVPGEEKRLSALMHASRESKQWLLHYVMRDLDTTDFIFWVHEYYKVNFIPRVDQRGLEMEI